VEYRGIRYILRARTEREEWYVSIHPAGERVVIGSREDPELRARDMIDDWLKKQSD
jgi:hypothetical protein